MAKSSQGLRARVSQATGRRRKKPANPVQRTFDDVRRLVADAGERFFSRSGRGKGAAKQASAKKAAAGRKRGAQQRPAEAKRGAVNRIGQRQAAPRKGGRTRAKAS